MINDHTNLPQIIHQSITQNEDETRLELDIYFHRDLIFLKGILRMRLFCLVLRRLTLSLPLLLIF